MKRLIATLLPFRILVILFLGFTPSGSHAYIDIDSLLQSASPAGAEADVRELLSRAEAEHGSRSLEAADACRAFAKVFRSEERGHEPEARENAARALSIREEHLGKESSDLSDDLVLMAKLIADAGDLAGAKPFVERAVDLLERAGLTGEVSYIKSLYRLAWLERQLGDYPSSRTHFERCLDSSRSLEERDEKMISGILWSYAVLLRRMGDFEGSADRLEQAIAIRTGLYGKNHMKVADIEISLAHLYRITGEHVEARRLYEHSIVVTEEAMGVDHPSIWEALNGLANLHVLDSNLDEAVRIFRKALRIKEEQLGSDHTDIASILVNLAVVLPDVVEAEALLNRGIQIYTKALGPNHVDVAIGRANLGMVLHRIGDYQGAAREMEAAIEIYSDNLGEDHPILAGSMDQLGHVHLDQGNLEEAAGVITRALNIREGAFGKNNPDVGQSLFSMTRLHKAERDTTRVIETSIRCESVSRDHHRLTSRSQAESEALRYQEYLQGRLDIGLAHLTARTDPGLVREMWNQTILSRALVLDEVASRRREAAELDDAVTQDYKENLTRVCRHLAGLVVRGRGEGTEEEYQEELDEATRKREEAERLLAERSEPFRNFLDAEQLGFARVEQSLPDGAGLLAYVSCEPWRGIKRADNQDNDSLPYIAFLLTHSEAEPLVIPLGRTEAIDSLVATWRETVGGGASMSDAAALERNRNAGAALRKAIWDPIADLFVGDMSSLYIVPDGAIHLVDFYALPHREKGYLIETGPTIQYLSAERDLAAPDDSNAAGVGLLALGGPDFDALLPVDSPLPGAVSRYRGSVPECGGFESIIFETLPGARKEVEAISTLWKENRKEGGGSVVNLTGAAATEAAFKESAPGSGVLHLATHAFFLGGECSRGNQGERGIGGAVAASPRTGSRVETGNPLLYSGLALAGSNKRASADEDAEDGILTAEEIASLDLSGVRLAVLSACGTGLGEVRAGEGVFGLDRAFRIAGVRTLLLSLWNVDDTTTRDWMSLYYKKLLAQSSGLGEVARETALTLLQRRRASGLDDHPDHWAGFVLSGRSR